MKIEIWHNILWSRYKGIIFGYLNKEALARNYVVQVFHLAETDRMRIGLGEIDLAAHQYPFEIVFSNNLQQTSLFQKLRVLATRAFYTQADVSILAGYHRPEYLLQAAILTLRRKKFAVFCDSTVNDKKRTFHTRVAKKILFRLFKYVFCYGTRSIEYAVDLGVSPANAFGRCQAAGLPDSYTPDKARMQRLAYTHSPVTPLFLFVGRLSPEKRLNVLIHAFAQVRESLPAARLRIVGQGPLADDLAALVASSGLGDSVEFTGAQTSDQLFANYSEATALVLPSISEPWGLVVNEALHFGCPVIVSEVCGCVPELVQDSQVGMVVRSDDIADLARKMVLSPTKWADQAQVLEECLNVIAPYTPRNAALSILSGLERIVAEAKQS